MANIDLQNLKLSGESATALLQQVAAGHYHEPNDPSFNDRDWRLEKLTGLRWQWFDNGAIDFEHTKMKFSTAGALPWELVSTRFARVSQLNYGVVVSAGRDC